ncbi:hypothetical protein FB567DRAFT_538590 [Paraphoma chrysanthemicola]|uniref:Uncharacterized protein n=1 Tax=Paraphoma chrysanthemicola TaxID=798071 RepID=A0A8K0QW40_9PLEO|nr:hypothetical protein FB567DRAFT_538590 [Paraphoma chrysanthemicola]
MSIRSLAAFALATGLVAAGPISAPQSKRNNNNIFGDKGFNGAVVNGFSGDGFNFADGFNNFNQQQQVIQIREENLQIIDNGRQQAVVQQVNEVLIVDQVNNGFNNDLNNLFRKSNFQNQRQEESSVLLVVQEIQVAIDDGRGNQFQQQVFAQSAVVANRGRDRTQTVMIFDSRTLVAADILGNNALDRIAFNGGVAGATDGFKGQAFPTKTAGVQLFGAKPTWSSVAADPAATLGGIWQGALQDLQDNENDEADNALNEQIAAQEKAALDEQKKAEEQAQKDAEQAAKDAEQQQQKDAEQAAKDAEQQQQEGEQKQEGEQQQQEAEQQKQAEADAAQNKTEKA